MKITFFLILIFINIIIYADDKFKNELKIFENINFDESMKFESYKKYLSKFVCREFIQRMNLYKNIFNKNHPLKMQISNELRIPKKIHQVWLGSEFPEKFKTISKKWQQLHPDWEYKLWTDENINELFPLYNQKIFDECANFGEKSDILRYEILYRFGGLYVDVDYECIKSFEFLSYLYDFYAGIEPADTSPMLIGNAFFATKAEHPILKHCIETIKDFRNIKSITNRTGPMHLTRSINIVCKKMRDFIIFLPRTFLYPLDYNQRKNVILDNVLKVETLGIHYWAGSWIK